MKIILLSHTKDGTVSFLIGGQAYYYRYLDGAILQRMIRYDQTKQPGKALNMAKKYAEEIRKPGKDWESNK